MRIHEILEGTMCGLNRSAPSTDVSYERMLDEILGKPARPLVITPSTRPRRGIKEQVTKFATGDVVKHPMLPKNGEVQYTRGNTVIVKSNLDLRLYKFSPYSLKKVM